ncbi:MAG: hypothetical protein H6Q17_550 [Bacteroidetes bacterium]|nr:hypothetical protein [Bacteroidota bacterium]
MFYDNPAEYLKGAGPDTKERINRLTTIIYNLENALADSTNGDVQNYTFNDGQSQISTNYRTLSDLTKAIETFGTIRERLINRSQGRTSILRDADTHYRYR